MMQVTNVCEDCGAREEAEWSEGNVEEYRAATEFFRKHKECFREGVRVAMRLGYLER